MILRIAEIAFDRSLMAEVSFVSKSCSDDELGVRADCMNQGSGGRGGVELNDVQEMGGQHRECGVARRRKEERTHRKCGREQVTVQRV